jgi:hypothetical protein
MLETTKLNTLTKIGGKRKVDLVRNRTIREQREIQPIEDKEKKVGKNGTTTEK